MPDPMPVIELTADELFARMHRFVAAPANQTNNQSNNQFLHSVGGINNLFAIAIAAEHPDTQAFVLKVIDKVMTSDFISQSINQSNNQSDDLSISQLFEQFLIALRSDDVIVQTFVVNQLIKHGASLTPLLFNLSPESNEQSTEPSHSQVIVHQLVHLFCHGATEIHQTVNQLFVSIAKSSNQSIEYLFSQPIKQSIFAQAELSWPLNQSNDQTINLSIQQSIIVLRILSLYIDVSCINETSLSLFQSSGLIDLIKQSINQSGQQSRDILYQLNCIELLDKFVQNIPSNQSNNQSINQLCGTILNDLVECLIDCLINCQSSFLLVSFVSDIESLSKASIKQSNNQSNNQTIKVWQNDPRLKSCLLAHLSSTQSLDDTALVACLNCVAVLATSHVDCLAEWLINQSNKQSNKQSKPIDWSEYLTSTNELIQLATISALTLIFSSSQSLQSNNQSNNQSHNQSIGLIYSQFFDQSIKQSIDQSIKLIWGPFYDQRLAMLKLARSMLSIDQSINQSIYQSLIKAGLIDRLIDRLTGDELEVRREKYECIKTIMNNPSVNQSNNQSISQSNNQSNNQLLSPSILNQLREFVRQGPLYVERTAAVMQPLTRGSD